MANAYLTRTPLARAFDALYADDDNAVDRVLSGLRQTSADHIQSCLERAGVSGTLRYLWLTLHRFATAPLDDDATIELCDRWMEVAPDLLGDDRLTAHEELLARWADAAAEAYTTTH